jgi:putative oxidoreductase
MHVLPRHLVTAARLLVGLTFLVFGLNGFIHFMAPPQVPATAGMFLGALGAARYVFPLLCSVELLAGMLLLSNRFVPLALVLLAPLVVNIAAFHLVLAPVSAPGLLVLLGELYLAWEYRGSFACVFRARALPASLQGVQPPAALSS